MLPADIDSSLAPLWVLFPTSLPPRFLLIASSDFLNSEEDSRTHRGGFEDPSRRIRGKIACVGKGPIRGVDEGIAMGQTIMPAYDYQLTLQPWKGKPVVTAAVDVDLERFLKTFETLMLQTN